MACVSITELMLCEMDEGCVKRSELNHSLSFINCTRSASIAGLL